MKLMWNMLGMSVMCFAVEKNGWNNVFLFILYSDFLYLQLE